MHIVDTSVPWFTIVFCGTRIVVTPDFISEILHVPRVDRLDYPSHPHLTSIFKDELASLFCGNAMLWGGTFNFFTTEFTKGPRFLNMVMTFVLTSRSHYNTITKPHACFLLSLIEGLSIDFPSHMIESFINCYHAYPYPYAHQHPSLSLYLCHGCHQKGFYLAECNIACYKVIVSGAFQCSPS